MKKIDPIILSDPIDPSLDIQILEIKINELVEIVNQQSEVVNKVVKSREECLCSDYDGKGKSTYGIDCPVHCSPARQKGTRSFEETLETVKKLEKEPTSEWEKLFDEGFKFQAVQASMDTPVLWRVNPDGSESLVFPDNVKQFISQLLSQQNERHAMYVAAIESNADQRLTVYKARVREMVEGMRNEYYRESLKARTEGHIETSNGFKYMQQALDDILQEIDKLK